MDGDVIEFKFTRGDWDRTETILNGEVRAKSDNLCSVSVGAATLEVISECSVGDKVLQMVAARLQESSRGDDSDTASRHSGDEFLYLVMESGDAEKVKLNVEKLISVIEAPCEVIVGDVTVRPEMRVSIGIAMYPANGIMADSLINAAGKAMYRAKKDKSGYSFAE